MTAESTIGEQALRQALEDFTRAIGIEFVASENPLRKALGIVLRSRPEILTDQIFDTAQSVFGARANEVLQEIAEGMIRGNRV